MKKILNLFVISCLYFVAFGCVGTVEQGAKSNSITTKVEKSTVLFQGIYRAEPISNDKVEVFFYPATGASGKYTYVVYNSAKPEPTYFPSEVLEPDYRGLLRVTINGLDAAEEYTFRVDVEDQTSHDYTRTELSQTAETFSNRVADFTGISSVSNLQGEDGMDAIKVRWVHATKSSSVLGTQPYDPIRYEITVVDATRLSPSLFHDVNLTSLDGRYVKHVEYNIAVNETIFRGLPSGTDFYVTVRAIHKNSIDNFNFPKLRGEMNTKYLGISTLRSDLASIDFDLDSLEVVAAEGERAKDTAHVSWGSAIGAFDHFRVYYALEGVGLSTSSIQPGCSISISGSGVSCKKTTFSENSTILANLKQSSNYQIMLVLCQTNSCEEGRRIVTTIVTHSTLPSLASFTGLSSVELANSIPEIGSFTLRFDMPDFSQGYFDGYVIGFKPTMEDVGVAFDKITEEDYNGALTVEYYDFSEDNQIIIKGVDYSSSQVHCFQIYPFIYASDGGKIEYPNNVWKCATPGISAPTKDSFAGISQAYVNARTINFDWNTPGMGIFDMYYVFVRKTPGSFDFSAAINESLVLYDNTNYDVYYVPAWLNSFTLTNLPNGQKKIGILTNYANDSGNYFSEFNDNVFKCDIDGTSVVDCSL